MMSSVSAPGASSLQAPGPDQHRWSAVARSYHVVSRGLGCVPAARSVPIVAEGAHHLVDAAPLRRLALLTAYASDIDAARLSRRARVVLPHAFEAPAGLFRHSDDVMVSDVAAMVASYGFGPAEDLLRSAVSDDAWRRACGTFMPAGADAACEPGAVLDALERLHRNTAASPAACRHVLDLMSRGADTSMVVGMFGIEPWRGCDQRGVRICHLTGAGAGVRWDVGIVDAFTTVLYAAVADWQPTGLSGGVPAHPGTLPDPQRDAVLRRLHGLGLVVRAAAAAPPATVPPAIAPADEARTAHRPPAGGSARSTSAPARRAGAASRRRAGDQTTRSNTAAKP